MELFHKSGSSGSRNGRRIASFAAIAATLALVATGCAATSDDASSTDSAGGDSPGSIVFLPKQLNNPYTDVVLGGGDAASKEIGFDASTLGPLEASASAQVPFIEQATQEGANVIVIAANDPTPSARRSSRPATPARRSSRSTPTRTPISVTCS